MNVLYIYRKKKTARETGKEAPAKELVIRRTGSLKRNKRYSTVTRPVYLLYAHSVCPVCPSRSFMNAHEIGEGMMRLHAGQSHGEGGRGLF